MNAPSAAEYPRETASSAANEPGNDDDSDSDQSDKKCSESKRDHAESFRSDSSACGDCCENSNEKDCNQVLDDEDPEHNLRHLSLNTILSERARDDCRT